jgi:hypothetical protein
VDQRSIVELQKQWWKRTNPQVLASHYAPVSTPYWGLDLHVPPAQIGERKRACAEVRARAQEFTGGDTLIVERIDFSVAMVPAIAGAGFQYDQHTSWSIPITDRIQDLRVSRFDPNHPLMVEYVKRLEQLLKHWSWETYLPSLADYLGPMDILAGLLGPQNLAMALYEEPAEVNKRAMDAAEFLRDMIAYEIQLHRDAGMTDGIAEGFSVWLPGTGVRPSEDFSALVGLEHFQEFFIEPLSHVFQGLDSCFLHTHSAAIQCVPGFLQLRNLGAIEFGNDPGGPTLDQRIEAGRLIQSHGVPLQMGSWNIPLPLADMERLVKSLDPRGLLVRFQTGSLEEARDLYQATKSWGGQCQTQPHDPCSGLA